ncbi:MAG: DUF4625 domain-containing protein [Bacteroidetes bacterium]|nr:DUF4625 domain-containing protein [Bacteroidota bacterium]
MRNIFFVLMVALAVSCDPVEVDVESPVLDITSFDPAPAPGEVCGSQESEVFTLRGGESLQIEALAKDDVALSQLKVDIHNNFDCHGHGSNLVPSIPSPGQDGITEDWTILEISDLDPEKEQSVSKTLMVPENITAGFYHLQIQVLDAAGNDDPLANFYAIRAINPTDEIAPEIHPELPAETNFSAAKGETLTFKGEVTDNLSLQNGGNGVLYLVYVDETSGNAFLTDIAIPFDTDTSYSYEFDYSVPQTLPTGPYTFIVGATDGVRNLATSVTYDVEVTD